MCGFITSFGISFKNTDFKSALNHLSRRGPDSEGVWTDDKVFMGSRRLAIFDLNNRSNQPMRSLCSRFIIVFNGAIYNYKELREYLLKKSIRKELSAAARCKDKEMWQHTHPWGGGGKSMMHT